MRRWDSLVEAYIDEYVARGLSDAYVDHVQRELERWGNWLRRRRPKPRLEALSVDLHVRFIQERTAFRAKSMAVRHDEQDAGLWRLLGRPRCVER